MDTRRQSATATVLFLPRQFPKYENESMKLPVRVLLAAAFCLVWATTSQAQNWMEPYNRLLGKYVTSSGVKYAAWKSNAADVQTLQTVVDGIAKEAISGLDKRQQLAFYLNAYDAWILHEALAKYPTASVKDTLFTFFTAGKSPWPENRRALKRWKIM